MQAPESHMTVYVAKADVDLQTMKGEQIQSGNTKRILGGCVSATQAVKLSHLIANNSHYNS